MMGDSSHTPRTIVLISAPRGSPRVINFAYRHPEDFRFVVHE